LLLALSEPLARELELAALEGGFEGLPEAAAARLRSEDADLLRALLWELLLQLLAVTLPLPEALLAPLSVALPLPSCEKEELPLRLAAPPRLPVRDGLPLPTSVPPALLLREPALLLLAPPLPEARAESEALEEELCKMLH